MARPMEIVARNEWLAEFSQGQHDLIARYWIEAIRAERAASRVSEGILRHGRGMLADDVALVVVKRLE